MHSMEWFAKTSFATGYTIESHEWKIRLVYRAAAMKFSQTRPGTVFFSVEGELQTYQSLQSENIKQDRSVPVLGKTVILPALPMMEALG